MIVNYQVRIKTQKIKKSKDDKSESKSEKTNEESSDEESENSLTKKLQVQTVIVAVRIIKRIQMLITPNQIQETTIEVSNI